ncbi:MAG: molybdenum cofactor guanylyltransferase, partial [Acidimicrobiia bacterium]|nr:molybdenum cofactor guanylyltransferase [Acidimicrobiia bacterium]
MESNALGAILTGGQSTRMGEDKALVRLAGKPMGLWVADALEAAGLEVATFGGYQRIGDYETIADPSGMSGPLAGLLAALEFSERRPVFIAAVDQPLLQPHTVQALLSSWTHDAVIPLDEDKPQVTCAVYRASCLPAIRQVTSVNPDASMRDLLEYISARFVEPDEWAEWGEDGRSWRSVDTPEDLAAVHELLG